MNSKTIYFKIASISIEITSSTPYVVAFFKKQYRLLPSTKKPSHYRLTFNVDTHSVFKMHINRKTGEISFPKHEDYSHFSFFFNFIVQLFVLQQDIVLLHASSVEKGQKGYIFSGPSGIGKTTTIKDIEPTHIYSNDVAILKKIRDNYVLLCSPFDRFFSASKKQIKLEKIFFLRQAKKTSVKDLQSSKGYESLLKNSIFYYFLDTMVVKSKKKSLNNDFADIKIPDYSPLMQKYLLQLFALRPSALLNKKRDDKIYSFVESL